jgi:3-methyl-2-oxobutanoate hydroxymethyltransferase
MSTTNSEPVTIASLQAMKGSGHKSVCVVAWDYPIARIADRVGVEIVSVGDSAGVNLWGHRNPLEITMDEMTILAKAVRRGVDRALLSCDFPFGPLQSGPDSAVAAAIRLAKVAGVDLVKLDGAADFPQAVEAVTRAGVPVFAQFGITPQTAARYGIDPTAANDARVPDEMLADLVADAKRLEGAGAVALNFTNSGPIVGPAVVAAVSIPVLGGAGGGPWLDGRIRRATSAIGYSDAAVEHDPDTYANVGRIAYDALSAYADDVRAGRQIRGGIPVTPN